MADADGNAAKKCPLCESTLDAGKICKTRWCIAGYFKNKTTCPTTVCFERPGTPFQNIRSLKGMLRPVARQGQQLWERLRKSWSRVQF